MRASARLVVVAALGCGVSLLGRDARAASAACAGTAPAFLVDTDGDGANDACDPCPARADATAAPSRDPYCYLSGSPIPPAYQASSPGAPAGAWWTAGACVPAMAFPVSDALGGSAARARGVVVVGAAAADAAAVLAAARAGSAWPAGAHAACLVSFDYAQASLPLPALALRAPALATTYATWTGPAADATFPTDGLGLIQDWPIESVAVRGPARTIAKPLQRLRFSRAAIYGRDLGAAGGSSCEATMTPLREAAWFDPTTTLDDGTSVPDCRLGAADVAWEPSDWRIIPTGLDDALIAHRDAVRRLLSATSLAASPLGDAIEGVPLGMRADDRNALVGARHLSSGAALFPQANGGWILVPEAIGVLRQHLLYRPADAGDYVVAAYPPTAPAQYSPLSGPLSGLLVYQPFQIDLDREDMIVDQAVRAVETTWPTWPAAAATSEASTLYGTRWTTNGGPRDCWTSTVDGTDESGVRHNQQLAYPVSVPTDNALAAAFCPSELVRWHQDPMHPAAHSQLAVNDACFPATSVLGALTSGLLGIGASCLEGALASNEAMSCCATSDCSITSLGDCDLPACCQDAGNELSSVGAGALTCMADAYMDELAKFTPDENWPLVGSQWIAMVALIRTNGQTPSVASNISREDMFIGGRHQGMDWNWAAEDKGAIDPAYRVIAMRDGTFNGIENELEFQVAMGQWKVGWNQKGRSKYELHGKDDLTSYVAGLAGNLGLSPLGEIWATTPPYHDLYGIDRSIDSAGASWPVKVNSSDDKDVELPQYWRHHFGRGLFAPIDSATLKSTSSLMSLNKDWPHPSSDPAASGFTSLGLADWDQAPHRLTFLGDPIVDCGHPPFKLEIHPPHVLTMDMARATVAGAQGQIVAAFGWMNVGTPESLEFDLWPTPRPSAAARLVVVGDDNELPPGSVAGAFGPDTLGWVVDHGPYYNDDAGRAQLSCEPAPRDVPNHVHCTYADFSNRSRGGVVPETTPTIAGDVTSPYANPRMTPSYATSRFDVRFFLGWK